MKYRQIQAGNVKSSKKRDGDIPDHPAGRGYFQISGDELGQQVYYNSGTRGKQAIADE